MSYAAAGGKLDLIKWSFLPCRQGWANIGRMAISALGAGKKFTLQS